MLAQNFKSAQDLGLEEIERDALIKTLVLLETEKLMYQNFFDSSTFHNPDNDITPFTSHFNMGSWAAEHECGTIACIGGTAEMVGKLPRLSLYHKANGGNNPKLLELFYAGERVDKPNIPDAIQQLVWAINNLIEAHISASQSDAYWNDQSYEMQKALGEVLGDFVETITEKKP